MAFASCSECLYRCRVSDQLAGKFIRCPKCRSVVKVKTQLDPIPGLRELQSNLTDEGEPVIETPDDDQAIYFIGKMIDRRGPVTMSQIRMLARWNLINQNLMLSDATGAKRTTIAEYLKHNGWTAPKTPPRNARKITAPPAPRAASRPAPPLPTRKPGTTLRPLEPLPPEPVVAFPPADEPGRPLMPDEFRMLLNRAVEMEKHARAVHIERPVTAEDVQEYVPSAAAKFIRRSSYSYAYKVICLVMLFNGLVFSLFSCATMGMFFKHLLRICVSVFIPFDSTGANIEGEPLLLAGLAFVFICGQLILPIWLLIRDDCVPWHGIGATVFGVLLGLVMKPEWLPSIFMLMRGAGVLSGMAVTGMTIWLISKARLPEVSLRLSVVAAVTAIGALLLTAVDVSQLLIVSMSDLSPGLSGSIIHISVFAISMYVIALSVPAGLLSFIYPEAPESVQNFMVRRSVTMSILGLVGAVGLLCIAFPPQSDFINAPLMMFPLMAGNMLLITIPPLMWILQPDYSLPRNAAF